VHQIEKKLKKLEHDNEQVQEVVVSYVCIFVKVLLILFRTALGILLNYDVLRYPIDMVPGLYK